MPAIYVKTGGTHTPVLQPYVKTSGTWTPILSVWVKTGGTWTLTWSGFTASASPTTGSGTGSLPSVASAGTYTASTSGGVGPFTYLWTFVSGDSVVATNATSATTRLSAVGMSPGETRNAVYKCVVTDTVTSVSADTNTVSVTLTRT